MPLRLTAFPSAGPARRRTLDEGRAFLIGRDANADIFLPDARVSRMHARLMGDDRGWRVEDLASKNGTQVDGRAVGADRLDASAWLNLGGVPIFVERIDAATSAQDAAAESARKRRASSLRIRVQSGRDDSEVLEGCLESVLELTACDRGGVWLRDAGGEPSLALRRGVSEPPESLSTIRTVLETGGAVITHDVGAMEALAKRESILLGGIRAIVCAPLKDADVVIGALYADSRVAGKIFTELDVELLQSFADHAAATLAAIRVRGEIRAVREAAAMRKAPVALA